MSPPILALMTLAAIPEPAVDLPVPASGWRIEVVAEAPEVLHPTVVDCAPDGRVFVGEDPMDIRVPADRAEGRVLCFFPDGRRTVFAEGLHAVFGMQYLEGKLYVLHNPKLSVFRDQDGVGRDRVDLIESTNPNPWALDWNDHVPANFRLAMDGYFYVSVGDKGVYGAIGRDGKRTDLFGGGILRLRPGATELEVFSTGTRNHLDVAVNEEDDLFTYDNTDEKGWWSRVAHMVDGGYYGYPWDHNPPQPFILPAMTDYGAGAATACFSYDEDALPGDYRGSLFLVDWGRREVFRLRIAREGATYRVVAREDIISNAPDRFRPVGMCLAPDGRSFYIADWRHPDSKADVKVGRLLRLTHEGESRAEPKPRWYAAAAAGEPCDPSRAASRELLEALRHASRAVRLCASRRLAERAREAAPGNEITGGLLALFRDTRAPARARWHALWTLDAIDAAAGARPAVLDALRDPDPSLRRQAARQLGTRRVRAAAGPLAALLEDADASVRLHAAAALGRIGDTAVVPALRARLEDADPFARQAVWTALNRIGRADPRAWEGIAIGLESPSSRAREGATFALRETHDLALVDALLALSADAQRDAGARAAAFRLLAGLHRQLPEWRGEWWAYHPVDLPRPRKTVAWEPTTRIGDHLRGALGDTSPIVRRAAAGGLREAEDAASTETLRAQLGREVDVEAKRSLLQALGALKDRAAAPLVAAVLDDANASGPLLLDAVAAAGRIGGAEVEAGLARLLERRGTREAGRAGRDALIAALETLGRLHVTGAAKRIEPLLGHEDIDVRRAAAAALGEAKDPGARAALLEAFRDEALRTEAAKALARVPDERALDAYLFGLGSTDAALREVCRRALRSLGDAVFPEVDARAGAGTLAPRVRADLQRVFAAARLVRSWHVLGPLASGTRMPFEPAPATAGGSLDEAELARKWPGAGEKEVSWMPLEARPDGRLDLAAIVPPGGIGVAYAHARIESRIGREADILLGSEGAVLLWINGEQVHQRDRARPWRRDDDSVPARLKSGANHILVRAADLGSGASFSLDLPAEREGSLFAAGAERLDPTALLDLALKSPGDAARGKAIFHDAKGAGCVKCHALAGQGGRVGPDLSGIGAQYDRARLAESIVFPSRMVRGEYRQTVIVTTGGEVLAGVERSQTPEEVALVDADGKTHAVLKADIASREASDQSLMPDGLSGDMSPRDLADVVAYLETLRGTGAKP